MDEKLFTSSLNTLPFDDSVRIRRGSTIPPGLKSYECFFNWAKLMPLTCLELGYGLLLLEEKFRDEHRDINSLLVSKGSSASTTGILCIAKKLIQAFFNIEIGKFEEAQECLCESEKFLRIWSAPRKLSGDEDGDGDDDDGDSRSIFCEDYLDGFRYIVDGIQVFLQIQMESPKSPTSPGHFPLTRRNESIRPSMSMEGLKHFKRLSPKAKYVVWTVRDVFFIYSARSNVERLDRMEAIMEMEPYIPKWHFYLYRALHSARKIMPRPAPLLLLEIDGEDEERIVTAAGTDIECGDLTDPLSISYRAMCLAQMYVERRNTLITNDGGHFYLPPWRFGRLMFEMPNQVLEKILEMTNKVLNLDCHLDGVYLNFSEIHMFLLPPESRSMELATRCLNKALRLNSTNTRTHYRLGLAHFKMGNGMQATAHFREAIKNPNNIGAIFGLLQILMSSPLENLVEIHSIFRVSMKNPTLTKTWDKECLRTLHYLKGCFHFMLQQDVNSLNEETITSWIIAHDNESPKWSHYFRNLHHQSTRFRWPTKRLNLVNVSNALKHAAYLERTQFRQLLLDICSEVDDAIRRKESGMIQTHEPSLS